MKICGVDPGYAIVGIGIIEVEKLRFTTLDYGAITTPAGLAFPKRLNIIYDDFYAILQMHKPDAVAIEKLYFGNNKTTGIDVAQARGMILLAAAQFDIPVYEYTPMQVKMAVTGYGGAVKKQVMEMTTRILHLREVPRPDDVADALAIAVCHAHSAPLGDRLQQFCRKDTL